MLYTCNNFFFNHYIGKGTVGVEARVPNAAGVGAESARRAETSVRAAAGRRSDHVAESSTLLEVMKGMDVIEVTKAPSEYCSLSSRTRCVLDVQDLMFISGCLLRPIRAYKLLRFCHPNIRHASNWRTTTVLFSESSISRHNFCYYYLR